MLVNSQELVQSYVLTSAKYNFSVYEKRIMYRLVQMAQRYLKGKKLDRGFTLSEDLFNRKIVTMPISSFLKDEKDKNYAQAKKALLDLESKKLEYEDDERWILIRLIVLPEIEKYSDTVKFEIQPQIWDAITQFSKGFSKYELKYAMSFNSTYSMRFYEMFSNNLHPITFTIQQLKERFKIEHRYKNKSTNFIKKVIIPAKKELDEKSPFSFKYQLIKTGRKITAIKFFPYKTKFIDLELEQKRLELQTSSAWELPPEVRSYLKQKYGFDEKGIRANIELFKTAYKEFDLLKFLAELFPSAAAANNPQAYTIGAIKKYIANKENAKPVSDEATNAIQNLSDKFKF